MMLHLIQSEGLGSSILSPLADAAAASALQLLSNKTVDETNETYLRQVRLVARLIMALVRFIRSIRAHFLS